MILPEKRLYIQLQEIKSAEKYMENYKEMITFDCPNCSKTYKIHESRAGQRATCGSCKHVFSIPAPKARPMPLTSGDTTIYEHFNSLLERLNGTSN